MREEKNASGHSFFENRPGATANRSSDNSSFSGKQASSDSQLSIPQISLPKGGGAIKSIDEKFSVNAINGTASFSLPLPVAQGRGFGPSLSVSYNSGAGNGIFGLGWTLSLSSIKRKTEKALPRYNDDSDTFVYSDAEDLVPAYRKNASGVFEKDADGKYIVDEFPSDDNNYTIRRYRPRIEGSFARIERWTENATALVHWKVTSPDNTTTVFGKDPRSRIADPRDPRRIYEWLIDFSYDSRGHCMQYEYKQEDGAGMDISQPHNRNRVPNSFTNTYIKRVRYGNVMPYNDHNAPLPTQWLFENVFDYGEHDETNANETIDWNFRPDAFSSYSAGFEIRTCRLCRRVLLFHHFEELPGGSALVRAVDFTYGDNGEEGFTFLQEMTVTGFTKHDDGAYTKKFMPPFAFSYQRHEWDKSVRSVSKDDLLHAPSGIDEEHYHFVDLYNEGLPGILTEQQNGWFYKSNMGKGKFTPAKCIHPKPSFTGLGGQLELADLEANGIRQVVQWQEEPQGFFELSTDNEWQSFRSFTSIPNIDFKDPNLRYIDLDGDGKADILITEDEALTWYASAGKEGFTASTRTSMAFDEENGPAVTFSNNSQTIFLADMNGDGLTDLVRIRNGEVCYWPSLGYGKFGAKVSMDHAPVFDHPDHYNPAFLQLADIDGSGTTDIVYLGKNQFTVWLNQHGNGFHPQPVVIETFPEITGNTKVSVKDILGNGMPCLVWNSNLPADEGQPLRYINLLNSKKPHVLTGYKNNMGREVTLEYKPSTEFFITDKLNGTPWVTRLHFPVHCVYRSVLYDRIAKTRFASEYSYHHGYYDHYEREFRGFARVDQKDAEDIDHFIKESEGAMNNVVEAHLHQPPVLTRSWYHTGAFLDREKILGQFSHEYFQNTAVPEHLLAEPQLPAGLSIDDWRQALRACKGMLLRQEVYALDGSPQQTNPYSVVQHNALIKLLQPTGWQQIGIFLVQESESLTYQYERNLSDPRVSHNFTLEVDDWGNVLQAAMVVYPRKGASEPEQSGFHAMFSEAAFTNAVIQTHDYHTPLPHFTRSYELTGMVKPAGYCSWQQIKQACSDAVFIDHQEAPTAGLQKRLLEFTRHQYRGDDGVTVLPFGTLQSVGLPHQSYNAVFNQSMLENAFGSKMNIAALQALLTGQARGGYVFEDGYYWLTSGMQDYDPQHFYVSGRFTDPFGKITQVEYDKYFLFAVKTIDAVNNETTVTGFNYRILTPYRMKDANDNEVAVRCDEFGMIIRSFSIGKKGIDQGDEFDDTKVEMKDANDFPGVEIQYSLMEWHTQVLSDGFDLNNYKPKPNFARTLVRDTHYHAHAQHQTGFMESYAYSDGAGRILLTKVKAEPEKNTADVRWVGNGRMILNNKGKPVKHYEPYFSLSPGFDDEKEMVELGVTAVIHYDAPGRITRMDMPDGTFTQVKFDAWEQVTFDRNDTVMQSRWYDERILHPVPAVATTSAIQAAQQAARHNDTPTIAKLDTFGRIYSLTTDKGAQFLEEGEAAGSNLFTEKLVYDVLDHELEVIDTRGRKVMVYTYDMTGRVMMQVSMDAGARRMVSDAAGKLLVHWDDRGHETNIAYDDLGRLLHTTLKTGQGNPIITERTIYGEGIADDKSNNLRGSVFTQYDQSGIHVTARLDFKRNVLRSSKQFTVEYKNTIDWTTPAAVAIETEVFETTAEYDALNRPSRLLVPHITGTPFSEIFPAYNEAGLPDSMEVRLREAAERTVFVSKIHYNAKAQREEIYYGNGTKTKHHYEKETFRLKQLLITRDAGEILQNISYQHDPMGNITGITDSAQPDTFFDGEAVKAASTYEYNAIYRLVKASGRKHAGQTQLRAKETLPQGDSFSNHPFVHTVASNAADAFRNYTELYTYDAAGNMLRQVHTARNSNWTRTFEYDDASNRLTSSAIGADIYNYTYDAHGNMHGLETLINELWDFSDQLREADLGGGGKAYYIYDASGQRTRKIIERQDGIKQERIYLGSIELYRERNSSGAILLERETLHVADGEKRIAVIDTSVIKPAASQEGQLIRYQYDNHQGSASLELDDAAQVISYEEYFPYGVSSYYTVDATREVPAKRYRYTGKERDEESGLSYHGARYYAPWICRWTAADPGGLVDGMNIYEYVQSNPVRFNDGTGTKTLEEQATDELEDFLKEQGVNYKREVKIRVKVNGEWVKGRADFLIEKEKGVWEPVEMKGHDKSGWTDGQKKYLPALQQGADFEVTGNFQKGYKGKGGGGVVTFKTLDEAREKFKKLLKFRIINRTRGEETEITKDRDDNLVKKETKPVKPREKVVTPKPDNPGGIGNKVKKFGKGRGRKVAELLLERGKRFVPGVGVGFGLKSGYDNFQKGNYLEGILDFGGSIPGPIGDVLDGVGTAYEVGKLGYEMYKEGQQGEGEGEGEGEEEEQKAPPQPKPAPKPKPFKPKFEVVPIEDYKEKGNCGDPGFPCV